MIIEACYCNWGIPGVDKLPAHTHPWCPADACNVITVWIDYQKLARELAKLVLPPARLYPPKSSKPVADAGTASLRIARRGGTPGPN